MKYELNVTTGQITQRDATASEISQETAEHAADAIKRQERESVLAAELAAKQSAREKLVALGLTEAEIAALLK